MSQLLVSLNAIIDQVDALLTAQSATRDLNLTTGIVATHQAHPLLILVSDITMPALFLYPGTIPEKSIAINAESVDPVLSIAGLFPFSPPTATTTEWDDPGMAQAIEAERNVRQIVLLRSNMTTIRAALPGFRQFNPQGSQIRYKLGNKDVWSFELSLECQTSADS